MAKKIIRSIRRAIRGKKKSVKHSKVKMGWAYYTIGKTQKRQKVSGGRFIIQKKTKLTGRRKWKTVKNVKAGKKGSPYQPSSEVISIPMMQAVYGGR